MQRLIARCWSREHAQDRLDTQWSPEKKVLLADYTIVSGCSWQHLADQCRIVYQTIISSII
jgi:dephospho-CoA kinase